MRIFVGNLPFNYTKEELMNKFKEYGTVKSLSIIKNKITGKSKGFGFLTIKNDIEAKKALLKLNGIKIRGRKMQVNKAERKRISRKINEKIFIL